jgi:hypothetical protein
LLLLLFLLLFLPLILSHLIKRNGIISLLFNWLRLFQACDTTVLVLDFDLFLFGLRHLINFEFGGLSHSKVLKDLVGSIFVYVFNILNHLGGYLID